MKTGAQGTNANGDVCLASRILHLLLWTADSTAMKYAIGPFEKSPHIYQCAPYHIPEESTTVRT